MPTVRMFYNQTMTKFDVCFLQGQELIGSHWEFQEADQVINIMEAANCRFRDIQTVRQTMQERRSGSIESELNQGQFDRLRSRRQRVQRKTNRG
jgi:hypothetical protein